MFKLFNSLYEIKTINDELKNLMWQPEKLPPMLNLPIRICYVFYYIFENIEILSTIKFLKIDKTPYVKVGMTFYYIALFIGLIKDAIDLNTCMNKKTTTPEESLNKQRQMLKILLGAVLKLGDIGTAAHGAGITSKFLGGGQSEVAMSLGGLVAGLIGTYNLLMK